MIYLDRRLIEADLPGRVAQHKFKFTNEHIRKRLSFAEGYQHWTKEQWERVLFSDEKIFNCGFNGRIWARRPPGEALNPTYCVDYKPHPEHVNVWGCFCARGLGYIHIFSDTLDGKLLKTILNDNLVQSADLHFNINNAEEWWFLQDNDPKHTSNIVTQFLFNKGIKCIDFPPHSPDLNPIENLWNDLIRRVELRYASTIKELQDIIAEEWEKTELTGMAKSSFH